jgi:drug/metabolite transporter (DMT)-like permease
MDRRATLAGLALAAGSGVLYGSINVLAKPLDLHPLTKGWVAYLASALLLSPALRGLRVARGDGWRILTMGLVGAGMAPALLFFGLQRTAAADAGLLLTLELVTTATLAMLFLGERFHAREGVGLAALLGAGACVALASAGQGGGSSLEGALLVLGAAVCWGIDNTVSARLVGGYGTRQLIAVKGLLGGLALLAASLAVQAPPPTLAPGLAMAALGISSIGVSSLLFYTALRHVGAARTSAMNVATTGLVGAAGGALLLGERLGWLHAAALALLFLGAGLLASRGVGRLASRRPAPSELA